MAETGLPLIDYAVASRRCREEIVSGDLYSVQQTTGDALFAVVDRTGRHDRA